MANFHNIKEYLYDNTLTENPNDFTASVASERSLSIKDICALPAGTYRVEVTTQYAVGSILKEPRTAVFDKTLSVP